MSARFFFIVLILGVCLVGILRYFGQSPKDILGGRLPDEKTEEIPFAIATEATSNYFNKSGQLSYTFTAKKLSHFRSEDNAGLDTPSTNSSYTLIESPHINMYRQNSPWVVDADRGRITSGENVITLEDNVSIGSLDKDENNITMTTSQLTIYPNQKMAKTDKEVQINSTSGTITALGMEADLKKEKIKLLSKVRGSHDPLKIKR